MLTTIAIISIYTCKRLNINNDTIGTVWQGEEKYQCTSMRLVPKDKRETFQLYLSPLGVTTQGITLTLSTNTIIISSRSEVPPTFTREDSSVPALYRAFLIRLFGGEQM